MSNFTNLDHYIIPSDLLMCMLDAYKQIGKTNVYLDKISSDLNHLNEKAIIEDAKALCELLNLNIADNRKAILLEKDGVARNKEEEALKNIKKVLKAIQIEAKNYHISASELVGYVNDIYGKHKYTYSSKLVSKAILKTNEKKTVRMLINERFDEFDEYCKEKKSESIILSMILFLDVLNLEPYSGENPLAGLLLIYYLLFQNHIDVFKYQSFFVRLKDRFTDFNNEIKNASMNYNDGYVQASGLSKIIFEIIIDAYNVTEELTKKISYQNQGLKSDNVELTIYKLPEFFTKDDIRKENPTVSDATINRILNKMRDDGLIMPLGTGRSAKWRKNQENIDNVELSRKLGD